jgi:hypothetical protein
MTKKKMVWLFPAFLPLLAVSLAQNAPSLPAPLGVPKPGPSTDAPYAPRPILPGGVVVTLYPPGSPFLNQDRVRAKPSPWQFRFIDWFRDLGFLEKPDVETKAAKDIAFYLSQPLPNTPPRAPSRDRSASHSPRALAKRRKEVSSHGQ